MCARRSWKAKSLVAARWNSSPSRTPWEKFSERKPRASAGFRWWNSRRVRGNDVRTLTELRKFQEERKERRHPPPASVKVPTTSLLTSVNFVNSVYSPRFVSRQHGGAGDARIVPQFGGHDFHIFEQPWHDVALRALDDRRHHLIRKGFHDAAAEHDDFRVEQVHQVGDCDAGIFGRFLDDFLHHFVT